MEPADALLTIAEIAIAVVGFAGIVFALRSGDDEPINVFRLRLMVEISLFAMAICLAPLIFLAAEWPEERLWAAGSAVLCVLLPIYVTTIFIRQARFFGAAVLPEARIADSVALALTSLISLALVLNALGLLSEKRFAGYLVGLLSTLAAAIWMFSRVILLSAVTRISRRPRS